MASSTAPDVQEMLTIGGSIVDFKNASLPDKTLILIAQLMEGGQEDDETCTAIKQLTKMISEDPAVAGSDSKNGTSPVPLHTLIDFDAFETILGYLDMRHADAVRGCASIAISTYFKVCTQKAADYLGTFFQTRLARGTYDDLILCFSVAACMFPVVPDISAQFFLRDNFIQSLGPLVRRKWKSKKVEQAALEMLNAACMNSLCRDAVQKYCTEWLEEMVRQHTQKSIEAGAAEARHYHGGGTADDEAHCENINNLVAIILTKLQASPAKPAPGEQVVVPTLGIEELADMLTGVLLNTAAQDHSPVEGLAYASLQPRVKEKLAKDPNFLQSLIQIMGEHPPVSPVVYGGLSIFANLTSYLPSLSEEQKKMTELKAYANAAPSAMAIDPLNDDDHVAERCRLVFEAGVVPLLVNHSQNRSIASLNLAVSIFLSLARSTKIRGQLAQQGAIKLLVHAYSVFPENSTPSRRKAAHALALILISVNPGHVFGGSTPLSMTSAIRPLVLLLSDDPTAQQRDLLPVFESLMALANLCSTEDDAPRSLVIRLAWPKIEDLLLSSNKLVSRATVELVCNLVQSLDGVQKFGDSSKQASHRVHLLLAHADSEDFATRRAAGGALASLTQFDPIVNAILERDRGMKILLALCTEDSEEQRHRGIVCVANIVNIEGKVGDWGVQKTRDSGGVEALKECLKKTRSQEVLELAVMVLQKIVVEEIQ